jgi:hypothetical protein
MEPKLDTKDSVDTQKIDSTLLAEKVAREMQHTLIYFWFCSPHSRLQVQLFGYNPKMVYLSHERRLTFNDDITT